MQYLGRAAVGCSGAHVRVAELAGAGAGGPVCTREVGRALPRALQGPACTGPSLRVARTHEPRWLGTGVP
jgi:hypothetical protein